MTKLAYAPLLCTEWQLLHIGGSISASAFTLGLRSTIASHDGRHLDWEEQSTSPQCSSKAYGRIVVLVWQFAWPSEGTTTEKRVKKTNATVGLWLAAAFFMSCLADDHLTRPDLLSALCAVHRQATTSRLSSSSSRRHLLLSHRRVSGQSWAAKWRWRRPMCSSWGPQVQFSHSLLCFARAMYGQACC